ncbi:hypothetical protein BV25DRAFT_1429512 [Artomyces pyxidatus]|uniref:Uncharacterized protein n=1 Tax=Artomyces pyxidatus TaxID=48021 RepID=A0ACB8SNI7_9AGAM|nr:hypothetical protein BV25DRAFT_1429512 [Artomyces pyxidatus]
MVSRGLPGINPQSFRPRAWLRSTIDALIEADGTKRRFSLRRMGIVAQSKHDTGFRDSPTDGRKSIGTPLTIVKTFPQTFPRLLSPRGMRILLHAPDSGYNPFGLSYINDGSFAHGLLGVWKGDAWAIQILDARFVFGQYHCAIALVRIFDIRDSRFSTVLPHCIESCLHALLWGHVVDLSPLFACRCGHASTGIHRLVRSPFFGLR